MEPEVAMWTTASPVELDRMITQHALTIGASIAKIEQDDDRTTERVLRDSQTIANLSLQRGSRFIVIHAGEWRLAFSPRSPSGDVR